MMPVVMRPGRMHRQLFKENGELSSAFEKADTNAAFPYSKRILFPRWEFVSQWPTAIDGGQAEFLPSLVQNRLPAL
jgi:hypothetical protein